ASVPARQLHVEDRGRRQPSARLALVLPEFILAAQYEVPDPGVLGVVRSEIVTSNDDGATVAKIRRHGRAAVSEAEALRLFLDARVDDGEHQPDVQLIGHPVEGADREDVEVHVLSEIEEAHARPFGRYREDGLAGETTVVEI